MAKIVSVGPPTGWTIDSVETGDYTIYGSTRGDGVPTSSRPSQVKLHCVNAHGTRLYKFVPNPTGLAYVSHQTVNGELKVTYA